MKLINIINPIGNNILESTKCPIPLAKEMKNELKILFMFLIGKKINVYINDAIKIIV